MTVMNSPGSIDECLELMRRVIECRGQPQLHHELKKLGDHSMLALDVLIIIYYFAKTAVGGVLEIGSFLGGATVAACLGVRDSGQAKRIVSIEPGGYLKKHRLATRNIFKDLQKNLKRRRLLDSVTLINGYSFEEKTIAAVSEIFGLGEVGLFIFDADANVARDIEAYADRFAPGCWVVIDDYYSGTDKGAPTRSQVDDLVQAGRMRPLGFYGWGTWVGRWKG